MSYNNTLYLQKPTVEAMKCNTNQKGLGVSDPLDIGSLSPRPNRGKVREQLKDFILLMLGAPVVTIELDEQQLDAAVDVALQQYEEWAPMEHFRYHVFMTTPGKSIYTMPPDIGYVRNVYYKQTGEFAFQSSDLGGAIPVEYFYPGGAYSSIQGGMIDPIQPIWGRGGEWALYKGYEQMYARMASNIGGWEWVGGYQTIKIYPIPYRAHRVVVHYLQKNNDWSRVQTVMQEGALAYAKIMLGRIRSKIKNPPGPGGGVQLDGDQLLTEGNQDLKDWKEQLITRYGDLLPISLD
jgi:hypothetical protein